MTDGENIALLLFRMAFELQNTIVETLKFNTNNPQHPAQDCEWERVKLAETLKYLEALLITKTPIPTDEFKTWIVEMQASMKREAEERRANREQRQSEL